LVEGIVLAGVNLRFRHFAVDLRNRMTIVKIEVHSMIGVNDLSFGNDRRCALGARTPLPDRWRVHSHLDRLCYGAKARQRDQDKTQQERESGEMAHVHASTIFRPTVYP